MDAGTKQLADILNGNRVLEVPYYQRSYVWKEEQWSRFLSDMEYITSTGKDYFLGSIILKQQPTGISPFDLQSIRYSDGKLRSADGIYFYVNTQWSIDGMSGIIKLAERDGAEVTKEVKDS